MHYTENTEKNVVILKRLKIRQIRDYDITLSHLSHKNQRCENGSSDAKSISSKGWSW